MRDLSMIAPTLHDRVNFVLDELLTSTRQRWSEDQVELNSIAPGVFQLVCNGMVVFEIGAIQIAQDLQEESLRRLGMTQDEIFPLHRRN
jgi:hypothetical protein